MTRRGFNTGMYVEGHSQQTRNLPSWSADVDEIPSRCDSYPILYLAFSRFESDSLASATIRTAPARPG